MCHGTFLPVRKAVPFIGNSLKLFLMAGIYLRTASGNHNLLRSKSQTKTTTFMSYQLSPDVGKPISKETANKWIKNHQDKHPEKGAIRARFFGSDIINELLAQDGCVGMRIYYATNDEGEKQLLLVGARADGSNIWPDDSEKHAASGTGGLIVDASSPCPPFCPSN